MQLTAGKFRAFDFEGNPLAYGKLYIYEHDSSRLAAVFTDYKYQTANTNPVILDEHGFATIFLAPGTYDLKLTDANDFIVWTVEGIQIGAGDTSGGGAELPVATVNDDGAMIYYSSSLGEWVLTPFVVMSGGNIDMKGKTITGVAEPTDDTDVARKVDLDNVIAQINYELRFTIQGTAQVASKIMQALMAHDGTIQKVKIYADEAPVGADLIMDIKRNGTSIFNSDTDRPTIVSGAHAGETSTFAYPTFSEGDRLSIDILQVGSSTAGGNDLLMSILYQLS